MEDSTSGSLVSCHELSYTISTGRRSPCCEQRCDKTILNNLTCFFRPGSMNAIIGATGSGKTSLLDALAGRKDPAGLTGTILIDGKPQPHNFKCVSGYVVQDDLITGTLTVRENLEFSANLRLPQHMSRAERSQKVDQLLPDLGLVHVANSKVGTELIRGVSGGERKRTAIGMEMIISPSVLFLDEPTTGLDSNTANAVMMLLYMLSRQGRTIIFSIHQPRFSIFRRFDQIVMLSQGLMVYHGLANQALDYFSSIGYECEPHNNPPDFFLDIINGDTYSLDRNELAISATPDVGTRSTDSDTLVSVDTDPRESLAQTLAKKFKASVWQQRLDEETSPIFEAHLQEDSSVTVTKTYATSFPRQLFYVSKRTVTNLLRNPMTSVMQFVIVVAMGLIVGLIYRDIGDNVETDIQNRVGAFFFIVMNQVFGNLSAVELFIKEKALFIHENSNGFYRVSAFFFAKVTCDAVPMRILPVMFFSAVSYFIIGLRKGVVKFFLFTLIVALTSVSAASFGIFFSSFTSVFAVANLLIALCYILMMLFGGFLVNVETIDPWLRWIQNISIFRYSFNAMYINEMKDLELCIYGNGTKTCDPDAGNKFLEAQGIAYETAWDFWLNIVALGSMTVIMFTLTYISLRRTNKYK